MEKLDISNACLVFPFSRTNANAISALLASLDIHETLSDLQVFLPSPAMEPSKIFDHDSEFHSILNYKFIILAVSVYSTQLKEVSVLIDRYKSTLKNIQLLVVAGGPHAIGDPFSMLYNGADIVCTGEGEIVFREIILNFISNKGLRNIPGTAYFEDDKTFVKTRKPDSIDLSQFPPFSLKHKLIRPIEITRGCAWKCRFCQIRSKGIPVRHRPVEQVLEYIQHTILHFSKRRPDIRFVSPNALSYGSNDGRTLNLDKVRELLQKIRDLIGVEGKIYFGSFPSELRPETITQETVTLLKNYSNVSKLIIGGQSGSNRILENTDRGHNVEEVEKSVELLVNAGFEVDVDIIFGLPGEEIEDIELTIKHMEKLIDMGAAIHSHTFLPLAGTPFASEPGGKIHPLYQNFIQFMQSKGKLKGQHQKQEIQAKIISATRDQEAQTRKYEFRVLRKE